MKKGIAFWMATLLCALILLGGAASAGEKKEVLFLSPNVGEEVWLLARYGAEKAADELGFTLTWQGPDVAETTKYNEMFETAISLKPAAIICHPWAKDAMAPILKRGLEAGVPIIACLSDPGDGLRTAYVGPDAEQLGYMQAEEMYKIVNAPLVAGVLLHDLSSEHAQLQVTGAKRFLETVPGSSVIDIQANGGDQVKTFDVFSAMVKANPEMNVLFNFDGSGAPGLGKVIQEMNLEGKIYALGHVETKQNIDTINQGVAAILNWNFFGAGYESAIAAFRAANGEDIDSIITTEAYLITKDNLEQVKSELGIE